MSIYLHKNKYTILQKTNTKIRNLLPMKLLILFKFLMFLPNKERFLIILPAQIILKNLTKISVKNKLLSYTAAPL